MLISRVIAIVVLMLHVAGVSAQTTKELPNIRITHFDIGYPSAGKAKIVVGAKGAGGMKVGSFVVRVIDVLPQRELKNLAGMMDVKGLQYLPAKDFEEGEQFLKDNGKIDEDQRDGVFATTIDASRWPAGRYEIVVAAENRPGTGAYFAATRVFTITTGNPSLDGFVANVPGAKHSIVFKEDGVYACFPGLTQLDDGRLYVTFGANRRATHLDDASKSVAMISSDGGATWSVTTERPQPPRWKRADGTVVMAGVDGWIMAPAEKKGELLARGRHVRDVRPGVVGYVGSGAFFKTSSDDGKTWQKHPIDVPDDVYGLMPFRDIATKDGIRIASAYGPRRMSRDAKMKPTSEVYFLRSSDDGKTWTFVYDTPKGLSNPELGFNETSLLELPNGDILAMMRSDPEGNLHQSISRDRGQTWSAPADTGIWGHPADMINLRDGRVLCIYGYRRAPKGIRACLSEDGGKTWDIKNELILRADGLGNGSDLGYPRVTMLGDGTLVTIYYIVTDGTMPHIAETRFNVPPRGR